jgi:hypothetical protein
MRIPIILLILTCFQGGYTQSTLAKHLRDQVDSAYTIKNYPLILKSMKALTQLSGHNSNPRDFYDLACAFSLNGYLMEAVHALGKSFQLGKSASGKLPVAFGHLMRDTDLDAIRQLQAFRSLIQKYFGQDAYEMMFNKEVSYSTLKSFLQNNTERIVDIKDKIFYYEKKDSSYVYNTSRLTLPENKFFPTQHAIFSNCIFNLNFLFENDANPAFSPLVFDFTKCTFNGIFFFYDLKFKQSPAFHSCRFNSRFQLGITVDHYLLKIDSCDFNSANIGVHSENKIDLSFVNNTSNTADIRLRVSNVLSAEIRNNSFGSINFFLGLGSVDVLRVEENKFENLILDGMAVQSEFDFQENLVGKHVLFNECYFSEATSHDIDWKTLSGWVLGNERPIDHGYMYLGGGHMTIPDVEDVKFITGNDRTSIEDDREFKRLMGLYSMFLNSYKSKNDIESYNSCFIEVKELQSKRLKYLFEKNGTFESYFRWKLSQLLKTYVRYGTDPARALVISFYIILTFGIFYFFFPSDWDITSKSRLIQNYQDFAEKNDKGYIKPFLILTYGIVLSFLNAVTLSLNAFVTLGFGNIPTHGIARYFCVLEGFLGWFLLSIFTVALINQVI